MKKTILYLVLLIAIGFATWYFVFSTHNIFAAKEASFTIKDTGAIGKIFIANNSGTSVLLERRDSGWYVNKQYKVMPAPIEQLLITLHEQEALYPAPKAAQENIIKTLAGNAVKVEVYDRNGEKMTSFYVGDEAFKFTGTNMLTEGAKEPYVVKMEGFSGYLRPRYTPYIKDWRDRTIFDVQPTDIRSISVQYPEHTINSFTITQDNGNVLVNTDSAIIKANKFNDRRAHVYLKFFTNINAEGYLNGFYGMDSILKSMPKKCIIDIVSNSGRTKHADIYWMPINRRSKNILTGDRYTPNDYDPDRLYAVINNNKDTVLIQNFVFEKIFRSGFEFYQPDSAGANVSQKHALTHPENVTPMVPRK